MQISISADIYCNPEKVFGWINDPDKALHWQKGVKGWEIIKATPEKTGTTFKEVMEENGKSLVMYGEITNYIDNELISFQLESKIHHVNVTYTVIGDGEKSTVLIESTIGWKFPMNLVSFFIGNKIKAKILDQTRSELSELKRICETMTNELDSRSFTTAGMINKRTDHTTGHMDEQSRNGWKSIPQ